MPVVGSGGQPSPPPEDPERVGDYVRRALPRELERRGISWSVGVEWDEQAISATLTRGGLAIRVEHTFGTRSAADWDRQWEGRKHGDPPWYHPSTREQGQALVRALADRLERWRTPFREADEEGCLTLRVWKDPAYPSRYLPDETGPDAEAVVVRLDPGLYPSGSMSDQVTLRRLAGGVSDYAGTLTQILAVGQGRILNDA